MLLRTFPHATATTLVTNTGGAIYLNVPEATGDHELSKRGLCHDRLHPR